MSVDTESIKCVILTLRKENVLLPNALVAEILSVKDVQEVDNVPDWYLGKMNWRGADVPLLSFEAAAGVKVSTVNLNTQAVVLYAVGTNDTVDEHPYLALVMSGIPHVSSFTREQIVREIDAPNEHPMVSQKVRINGANMSILDVDAMLDMVSEVAA